MNAAILESLDFFKLCVDLGSPVTALSSSRFLGSMFCFREILWTAPWMIKIPVIAMKGSQAKRHIIQLFAGQLWLFDLSLGSFWPNLCATEGTWDGSVRWCTIQKLKGASDFDYKLWKNPGVLLKVLIHMDEIGVQSFRNEEKMDDRIYWIGMSCALHSIDINESFWRKASYNALPSGNIAWCQYLIRWFKIQGSSVRRMSTEVVVFFICASFFKKGRRSPSYRVSYKSKSRESPPW